MCVQYSRAIDGCEISNHVGNHWGASFISSYSALCPELLIYL